MKGCGFNKNLTLTRRNNKREDQVGTTSCDHNRIRSICRSWYLIRHCNKNKQDKSETNKRTLDSLDVSDLFPIRSGCNRTLSVHTDNDAKVAQRPVVRSQRSGISVPRRSGAAE